MLFNHTFVSIPSGMQGLTQPCTKYLKYFHSALIFIFFPVGFHGVSHSLSYSETISELGPPRCLAGLCYILLILH